MSYGLINYFKILLMNLVTDIYDDRPIKHIPLTLVSSQPIFPLTILSISTISKGADCTEDARRSYPVGRSPQQKKTDRPFLFLMTDRLK